MEIKGPYYVVFLPHGGREKNHKRFFLFTSQSRGKPGAGDSHL
jgi:hypothetical protein